MTDQTAHKERQKSTTNGSAMAMSGLPVEATPDARAAKGQGFAIGGVQPLGPGDLAASG